MAPRVRRTIVMPQHFADIMLSTRSDVKESQRIVNEDIPVLIVVEPLAAKLGFT